MTDAIAGALIGDFDPAVIAHRAIPEALKRSAERLGVTVKPEWVPTTAVGVAAETLKDHVGIWCVPASPYASADGAQAAIRYARESSRPFLGTCGGFQHAILEYARNVLGYAEADHAETAPAAAMPVIARLTEWLCECLDLRPGMRMSGRVWPTSPNRRWCRRWG